MPVLKPVPLLRACEQGLSSWCFNVFLSDFVTSCFPPLVTFSHRDIFDVIHIAGRKGVVEVVTAKIHGEGSWMYL